MVTSKHTHTRDGNEDGDGKHLLVVNNFSPKQMKRLMLEWMKHCQPGKWSSRFGGWFLLKNPIFVRSQCYYLHSIHSFTHSLIYSSTFSFSFTLSLPLFNIISCYRSRIPLLPFVAVCYMTSYVNVFLSVSLCMRVS